VLQVGSFRTYEEADRLKASLSLMGLEANIQTVSVDGKPAVHRVRVGPYTDMAKVNDARRRLREHSLEPILLKIKA
jgi:cell division protein FtsN